MTSLSSQHTPDINHWFYWWAQGSRGQIPSILQKKAAKSLNPLKNWGQVSLISEVADYGWSWTYLQQTTLNHFLIFSSINKVLTGFNMWVEGGQHAWKKTNAWKSTQIMEFGVLIINTGNSDGSFFLKVAPH